MRNEECRFVDTHTHIHMKQFDKDREELIRNFEKDRMLFIIEIGVDMKSNQKVLKLANENKRIFAAVGVHPHDVKSIGEEDLKKLEEYAKDDKVVAIGETGLDFYRNLSPKDVQVEYFIKQIKIAERIKKPLIVHIRDAYDEALEILERYALSKIIGVVHSFSGEYEHAKKIVNMGFKLGIGGTITFKKNEKLGEIVRKMDLIHIIPETDCPYLTPQPFRGRRNEPKYVKYVVEKIAIIKGMPISKVCEKLIENSTSLFNIEERMRKWNIKNSTSGI